MTSILATMATFVVEAPPGTETEGTGAGTLGTVVFLAVVAVILTGAAVLYLRNRRRSS